MSKFDFLSGESIEPLWSDPHTPLSLEGFLLKCRTFNISMSSPMRVYCPSLQTTMKIEGARLSARGIELQPGSFSKRDASMCRPSLLMAAYGTNSSKEMLIGPTGKEVFILGWSKEDMVLEELP